MRRTLTFSGVKPFSYAYYTKRMFVIQALLNEKSIYFMSHNANLTPANVKNGVNVGGVVGSYAPIPTINNSYPKESFINMGGRATDDETVLANLPSNWVFVNFIPDIATSSTSYAANFTTSNSNASIKFLACGCEVLQASGSSGYNRRRLIQFTMWRLSPSSNTVYIIFIYNNATALVEYNTSGYNSNSMNPSSFTKTSDKLSFVYNSTSSNSDQATVQWNGRLLVVSAP